MDINLFDFTKTINLFFDGLFFGFSVVMIIAIIAYVFIRNQGINAFIYSSIKVVRVLAIAYLIFYTISFALYYVSPEFQLSARRSNDTYKWAYWFMVLRPILFCLLLLLFWLKFWTSRLRYVSLLVVISSIILLPSAIFFEKIVLLLAAQNIDYYESHNNTYLALVTIVWYIFEKAILFAAIVFASMFISNKTAKQ
ncbi:hypothetical protein [Psychroserpens sp. MEBiC05023]